MGAAGTLVTLDDIYLQEAIQLNATYAYHGKQVVDRTDHRTSHQAYTYIFESWKEWDIPETWVNSWSRSVINSWQATNAQLRLLEHSSNPTAYEIVEILNKEHPYQNYQDNMYLTYFTGILNLGKVSKV
jgi:hypothetical protein